MKTENEIRTTELPEPDFEALFEQHSKAIFCAAFSVTGSPQDAEEVLQNVFLRLMQRQEPAEEAFENPAGYLYRAAINEALHIVRSRQRRRETDSIDDLELPACCDRSDHVDDVRWQLEAALEKLKPDILAILVLYYDQGYTDAEIAKLLGRSRSAVSMALVRAREELRELMGI